MIPERIKNIIPFRTRTSPQGTGCSLEPAEGPELVSRDSIGLIAGNGSFPLRFIDEANRNGTKVFAVCYKDETDPAVADLAECAQWTNVGELGKLISFFKSNGVKEVALAGGINRIKHFGDVKLDAKGAALLLRLRSTKDDVIMRGIADELAREGIAVVHSTIFLKDFLVSEGQLTRSKPTTDEWNDIQVGIDAITAMSAQDIGQLVVVREGVVVAVEAAEGTNAAVRRGGELGGSGCVVVKFAKTSQDMRFDVPTVGLKTIETLIEAKARVLALEATRSLIIDKDEVISLANKNRIAIVGCRPLVAVSG